MKCTLDVHACVQANADGRHDRASALQRGMSSGAAGPQPAGHLHAAGEKRDRGDAGSSREGRRPSRVRLLRRVLANHSISAHLFG
jgi:hypothetical protein